MDAPGRMLRASHRNRSRGDGWFLLLFFVYKMVKFDASEIVESLVNKSSLFRVENHVNSLWKHDSLDRFFSYRFSIN